MARKKDAEPTPESAIPGPSLESIEDLCERHRVPRWARAGLMVRMGWAAGKRVTESEFLAAWNTWLTSRVGR